MITENDIAEALGRQLQSLADIPTIYWENQDVPETQARPYVVVQMVPGQSPARISGGKVQTGFMQVTHVSEVDRYATSANRVADNIAALFPYELTLPCGDGKLTITRDTVPGPGFRDGSDWRKIVQVDYVAI
ncbi:phage tail terminator-like protein [Sulfitobacter sp. PM12]|uniref:phage tail terminator-like protein n=1 Tax=Sulfitobacter sp. PM12 TaxID=3138497 RepID=UPI00388D8136